jgi:hypothetical protein
MAVVPWASDVPQKLRRFGRATSNYVETDGVKNRRQEKTVEKRRWTPLLDGVLLDGFSRRLSS